MISTLRSSRWCGQTKRSSRQTKRSSSQLTFKGKIKFIREIKWGSYAETFPEDLVVFLSSVVISSDVTLGKGRKKLELKTDR